MSKAVFIDRDGTIAKNGPYISRPEDFELLPRVGEGIRLISETGIKVVVITNQSGVARGYFTENKLHEIHDKMQRDLADSKAHIDAIYYCPHHPNDHCECRKPNIGLLKKASLELGIELRKSFFMGDRQLDMETANKADCRAVLVPSKETEERLLRSDLVSPHIDFICQDFYTGVQWIVEKINLTEEHK